MAVIAYLDSFPADNALEIIQADGRHQLLQIDSGNPVARSLAATRKRACLPMRRRT